MKLLKNYTTLILLALMATALLVPACKDGGGFEPEGNIVKKFDYKIVYDWNEAFLQTERYAAGYRPGPAPRALAYMGLSAYEACITGMPNFNSVANLYPGLSIPAATEEEYHWPTVVNASYAYLFPRFFPSAAGTLQQSWTALQR